MSELLVDVFADLFEGRKDAYGLEEGGCARFDNGDDVIWKIKVRMHLGGEHSLVPLGVYPMVPFRGDGSDRESPAAPPASPRWFVKWGCVDLDVKGPTHKTGFETVAAANAAARNLVLGLKHFGVTGWIEHTRSGGKHVWVFAETWVPAATMRRALWVACHLVDVPPTEVNPKSEGFDDLSVLGNYVRLPYPGHLPAPSASAWASGVRMVEGLSLAEFVRRASQSRVTLEQLEAMAELYIPPHSERTVEVHGVIELDEALRSRLSGLAWTILRDGPLDGQDRSSALMRLAHQCERDGLTPDQAFAVVVEADKAWGKFWRRRNGEKYLMDIVERAY